MVGSHGWQIAIKQRAEIIYEILQKLPVKLVDSGRRSRTSIVFHANTQEISHMLNDRFKAAQIQYYHGHSAVGGFIHEFAWACR